MSNLRIVKITRRTGFSSKKGILTLHSDSEDRALHRYQIRSGKNLFDWIYIGNVAQAHVKAAYALLEAHGKTLSSISTAVASTERRS